MLLQACFQVVKNITNGQGAGRGQKQRGIGAHNGKDAAYSGTRSFLPLKKYSYLCYQLSISSFKKASLLYLLLYSSGDTPVIFLNTSLKAFTSE